MAHAEAAAHVESPLAASYDEWCVTPSLRARLACAWTARLGAQGERHVQRIIPDGCIDLLFTEGELIIAGPDTESVELEVAPNRSFVGVRFRAGQAATVLGVPASQLRDQRIDALDVLGARACELSDRLAAVANPWAAAALMQDTMASWVQRAPAADALVAHAIAELSRPRADWSLATLAARLGVSERQLRRRFLHAVGYGPKLLERVLRLRRFIQAAAARQPHGLARLAADAGYADQPHLTRECRELTALTPAQLLGYPVTAA